MAKYEFVGDYGRHVQLPQHPDLPALSTITVVPGEVVDIDFTPEQLAGALGQVIAAEFKPSKKKVGKPAEKPAAGSKTSTEATGEQATGTDDAGEASTDTGDGEVADDATDTTDQAS